MTSAGTQEHVVHTLIRPLKRMKEWVAGGIAGGTVDLVLFPLDTIKTRLQATWRGKTLSPGQRAPVPLTGQIYRGVSAVALGGAPNGTPLSALCVEVVLKNEHSGTLFWDLCGQQTTSCRYDIVSAHAVAACRVRC